MARYFFDVIEDGDRRPDAKGDTFASLEEATREAYHGAAIIAQERFHELASGKVVIEVRDGAGVVRRRTSVTFRCN